MGFLSTTAFLIGLVGVKSQCDIESSFTIVSEDRPLMNGCYDYVGQTELNGLSYPRYYDSDGPKSLFVSSSVSQVIPDPSFMTYFLGYFDSGDPVTCWSAVSFKSAYDYVEQLNNDGWRDCTDRNSVGDITITCGCGSNGEVEPTPSNTIAPTVDSVESVESTSSLDNDSGENFDDVTSSSSGISTGIGMFLGFIGCMVGYIIQMMD